MFVLLGILAAVWLWSPIFLTIALVARRRSRYYRRGWYYFDGRRWTVQPPVTGPVAQPATYQELV
jgi:hypothetical protein